MANVSPQIGLHRERLIGYASKKFRVPIEVQMTEEENQAYSAQIQQQQEAMLAEKALGEALQMQGQEINQNEEVENAG